MSEKNESVELGRIEETTRMLDCVLTPKESSDVGKALAATNQRKSRLEAEKKSNASEFKAEIDKCDAQIENLSLKSVTGIESRNIDCELRYNSPECGLKSVYRLDNEECIETHSMSVPERADLFINMLGLIDKGEDGKVFVMRNKQEVPFIDADDITKEDNYLEIVTGDAETIIDSPLTTDLEYRVVMVDDNEFCLEMLQEEEV